MHTHREHLRRAVVMLACALAPAALGQVNPDSALDLTVRKFLESHRRSWRDMNIPASDGQLLFDIILRNRYTKALEIGTSTGHSAIWMAWALSKTGGRLVTIEIDGERHEQAVANFKAAGLSHLIDAKLGDAHELVPTLKGPFDFVFCDADKDWYTRYFMEISPRLEVGGCYTAHNVREGRWWPEGDTEKFLAYVRARRNYTTTVDNSGGGVSISTKESPDREGP